MTSAPTTVVGESLTQGGSDRQSTEPYRTEE